MLNLSIFCHTHSLKQRIDKQTISNVVYILIFSYLILYSILNTLYLHNDPVLEPHRSDSYNIGNVTVSRIRCSFPISEQYQKTPRYSCYLLLVFTVVIRNHRWLAVGAAASVLTYSGIAAIHMIILFATNNRTNLPKAKTHCEFLPVPGSSIPFAACAGVDDPDVVLTLSIVSSVMLGALPTAAWSTTFKRSTSKAILMFWLLLLAVGHPSYLLTSSNPNPHFQICPKDHSEPFPATEFQATLLDRSWRDSFYSLISTAQQRSHSLETSLPPRCIYSCFVTAGYIGRKTRDISVWGDVRPRHPWAKDIGNNRRGGITLWWAYTLLAFITLFITEKKGRLPKGLYKPLFSIEYCRQPSTSRWRWGTVTHITIKGIKDPITAETMEATIFVRIHVTVLKVVQYFTQFISAAAFCASIVWQETQEGPAWSELSQEPFAAVGQWSYLAVVLLVLVAAGLSRIWGGKRARSVAVEEWRPEEEIEELEKGKVLGRGKNSLDGAKGNWRSNGDEEATEKEDWDRRIGYAS